VILIWGIVLGLLSGFLRAARKDHAYHAPQIHGIAIVFVAFLPQFLVFSVPLTRENVSTRIVSTALVLSQLLLLVFVSLNRRYLAFWIMGAGLLMNLVAILANGGLMPISLETLHRLVPSVPAETWTAGARLGYTKDIILAATDIRLSWLVDRFVVPDWYPQRVAFSLGDVLVASGAFWLFWQAGQESEKQTP
jgi:hypothetical protein